VELNLAGKVVVITGGATGIGRAAALEFLKEGCKVAICGRRQEKLDEVSAFFLKEGYNVLTKSVDVCDEQALSDFGTEVVAAFGGLDIWINNAGQALHKTFISTTAEEFRGLMEVNLLAVFFGCRVAYQHMRGKGGVILNASSFAALAPFAGRGVYAVSKAAVLSLTRTCAAEFAADNIRVVAYVPGTIMTELSQNLLSQASDRLLRDIPLRRFGTTADLAKVLVFMASDAAAYINGTHVEIAGGKRCVQNPEFAWLAQETK
jgi:NAD(P)-dependent dehydrogenase (short-subunit alcohol dehydrogenase family)